MAKKGNTKVRRTFYERFVKRFLDVVLSFLALIVLSPLMLLVAILSKIFLGGKVILKQYRPGRNGKVFKLYKFRSMTDARDENGELLPDKYRVTKFGKIIRKLSIDELPQLFNILKGDMSIVGPRPRLVKDMVFYPQEVYVAFSVKPGLTGLDSVKGGRSTTSWESIFEYCLEYQRKITFWGDLKILFLTVLSLFKSDSSSEGAGVTEREYYYADYLLKTQKITQEQYDLGMKYSREIIDNKGQIEYKKELIESIVK